MSAADLPRFLFVVANLNREGPAIAGKELKGPLGWVEVATPEGCGHPVGWFDEVWVHGMWLPRMWGACRMALRAGKRLVRMTHGSLSPIYLERQSKWKKHLVSPIERHYFAKCDRVVVTGGWEEEWCRKWGLQGPFETVDLKGFFDLSRNHLRRGYGGQEERKERKDDGRVEGRGLYGRVERVEGLTLRRRGAEYAEDDGKLPSADGGLHLLYLGRRHPLKGIENLEKAVAELNSNPVNPVNPVQKTSTRSTRLKTSAYSPLLGHPLRGQASPGGYASQRLCVKIISNAYGEELEKVWDWCDVLVLPTLSENFGLVIAEALERGKCVITTDGAPAWEEGLRRVERVEGLTQRRRDAECAEMFSRVERVDGGMWSGYGGRLIYLKGYRAGTKEQRVELLRRAIELMSVGEMMAVS